MEDQEGKIPASEFIDLKSISKVKPTMLRIRNF